MINFLFFSFYSSKCINYLSGLCYYVLVSNHSFYTIEFVLLNSLERISLDNNNYRSMNNNNHHHHHHHQFSCKSILKRKSLEIQIEDNPPVITTPVIKPDNPQPGQQCSFIRNISHNNSKSYRQGILKKHSASFDDDSTQKPILKNRCLSCDDEAMFSCGSNGELHSILKRKTSEPLASSSSSYDGVEPHGILKKREMPVVLQLLQQQQSSSDDNRYHTTMADNNEDIRPILKHKKFECDAADENGSGGSNPSYPRPILKKKSVDSADDKKPILKSSSRSNSPAKRSSSKRLSVAQRVSNLESLSTAVQDASVYKKPVKESVRNARDRSRFHTQPVTPSELIKAVEKYVYNNMKSSRRCVFKVTAEQVVVDCCCCCCRFVFSMKI